MPGLLAVVLGFGLGLSLAAPPGPMNALIARESTRHGASAGIKMGIAAPVADTVYLALLLLGSSVLPTGEQLRWVAWAGAALMAVLSYGTWFATPVAESARGPTRFWTALAAALTNPYQIAWWVTGGFLFLQSQGWWGIAGLLLGIFGWVVAFSWLVAHGARKWAWFEPTIRIASALVLSAFAVLLTAVALGLVSL